jgi:hypothetical protein
MSSSPHVRTGTWPRYWTAWLGSASRLPLPWWIATIATLVSSFATASLASERYVHPNATFLRNHPDDLPSELKAGALDPDPIPLSDFGLVPGQWVEIRQTGDYMSHPSGPDEWTRTIGVFTRGSRLLPPDRRDRLPGAMKADTTPDEHPAVTVDVQGLATDIEEDFTIADDCLFDSEVVRIPQVANSENVVTAADHLWITALDHVYRDNSDPDEDFLVQFTPRSLPAPLFWQFAEPWGFDFYGHCEDGDFSSERCDMDASRFSWTLA